MSELYPEKNSDIRYLIDSTELINPIYALEYEVSRVSDRVFSVLNKVNTNRALRNELSNLCKFTSNKELNKWIYDNKIDLFTNTGKYFPLVFNTIRATEIVVKEMRN
jgi:hypothetical protein